MSEIKVNKISPRTACGTTTLGDSGDTFTIPSGVTISNLGTASGFGGTGEISWDTTVKTTGTFTATAGIGYFLNTTGGVITVNLPAGTAGASVAMVDYAGTWQTSKVTVSPNGTEKMGGVAEDAALTTEGQSVTFVYIDGTQGWVNVLDSTSNVRGVDQVVATGGNAVVTCGDYKTHIFTGPGTFCVSGVSTTPACNAVEYLVVGSGASGGSGRGGGGGAGGFRYFSALSPAGSPLVAPAGITVSVQGYPIVVGAGAAGQASFPPAAGGNSGAVSSFSTISSAGGGGGGSGPGGSLGLNGGSGGGQAFNNPGGGVGNTPPTSPAQGTNGGTGNPSSSSPPVRGGGGGGGAGAAGGNSPPSGTRGAGGVGSYVPNGFIGPTAPSYGTPGPVSNTRYFAGGGGAGGEAGTGGAAPDGGGGTAGKAGAVGGCHATVNTGGGSGAAGESTYCGPSSSPTQLIGNGGSGIVMIRYKYQ